MSVARAEDIPEGSMRMFKVEGEEVVVAHVDGGFYAFGNFCTHAQAPMVDGYFVGCEVICAYHGAGFDVKTGQATGGPAYYPLPTFAVRLEDGDVQVERRPRAPGKRPSHLRIVSLDDGRQ
jgi:3-phenylpropionate/trans-cinnamate dioxygenase ferredoxin subunit